MMKHNNPVSKGSKRKEEEIESLKRYTKERMEEADCKI